MSRDWADRLHRASCVARDRAWRLERSLRRADARSRDLDRALRRLRAEIAVSRMQGLTAEAPLLTSLAMLLPPDLRTRFIEEQAANLTWANRWERPLFLAGLVAGM